MIVVHAVFHALVSGGRDWAGCCYGHSILGFTLSAVIQGRGLA